MREVVSGLDSDNVSRLYNAFIDARDDDNQEYTNAEVLVACCWYLRDILIAAPSDERAVVAQAIVSEVQRALNYKIPA